MAAPQTVIFLDVDGVLNVGIKDDKAAALLFRDKDVRMAQKLAKKGYRGPEAECVAKLTGLASHPLGDGEQGSYEMLMTQNGAELSDVLVGRFAELVRSAGDGCKVVLSSSWRRPHHLKRRMMLEETIGRHLDRHFEFTDITSTCREERHAADRLETIGDYLFELRSNVPEGDFRVLVLEDFFISAMNGWLCGGQEMDCVNAAERYLENRARNGKAGPSTFVKLYHCYDEITTNSGVSMQVGKGFSDEFLTEAKAFIADGALSARLAEDSDDSTTASSQSEGEGNDIGSLSAVRSPNKECESSFMQLLSAALI